MTTPPSELATPELAAKLQRRIDAEAAEVEAVRKRVTTLLGALQPWQRKAVITSVTHYTVWPVTPRRPL